MLADEKPMNLISQRFTTRWNFLLLQKPIVFNIYLYFIIIDFFNEKRVMGKSGRYYICARVFVYCRTFM